MCLTQYLCTLLGSNSSRASMRPYYLHLFHRVGPNKQERVEKKENKKIKRKRHKTQNNRSIALVFIIDKKLT